MCVIDSDVEWLFIMLFICFPQSNVPFYHYKHQQPNAWFSFLVGRGSSNTKVFRSSSDTLSLSLSLSLSLFFFFFLFSPTGLCIFVIGEVTGLFTIRIHLLLPNFLLLANSVLLEKIKNEIKEKKSGPTTPVRYCRTSGTVGSGIAKFNCIIWIASSHNTSRPMIFLNCLLANSFKNAAHMLFKEVQLKIF